MTKPKQHSDDKLIMAVRKALKDVEPRKMPTEKVRNPFGFWCWVCPYCKDLCHIRGYSTYGGYNMHFASMHGKKFWREQHVIETVKRHINA